MRPSLQHRSFRSYNLFPLILLLSVLTGLALQPAQAQTAAPSPTPIPAATGDAAWRQPVNLSRSGAASQPQIFAAQDGRLQAFWIDRFDGLMTALFNGEMWSLPAQTLRVPSRFTAKPVKITAMPYLLADDKDRVHAFYYGEKDAITGEAPLFYNQLAIGATLWSPGVQVADSALVFSAQPVESGDLQLAYIRSLKTEPTAIQSQPIPPGVYTRRTTGGGAAWTPSSLVETSIYYRILPPEKAFLQMAVQRNVVLLAWRAPRLDQTLYSASTDGGLTWSPPVPFANSEAQVKQPLLAILPSGQALRIWQDASQSGCALYQQQMDLQVSQPLTATQTPTPQTGLPTVQQTPMAAAPLTLGEWSQPQPVLAGLSECPGNSRFFSQAGKLYWLWGEGTPTLNLTAWDAGRGEWALPQSFSFSFEDPDTRRIAQLDNLRAVMAGDKLAVIGADAASGEVWTSLSQASAFELAFAAPSPWSAPLALSDPGQVASQPVVAIDSQSRAHLVWRQATGSSSASLFYARYAGGKASPAVEIVKSAAGEALRQPNLWVDAQDRLHLTWSGGTQGEIYYTRALADQAGSASGWLPARQVSGTGSAAWPQLAQDPAGRTLILYAAPLNEGRGLYLVHSEDAGENWSAPAMIFDAAAAGWEMVDHPSLAVDRYGALHVAWTRANPAAAQNSQGIFYTYTLAAFVPPPPPATPTPGGTQASPQPDPQWARPLEIAPPGADWPRLAALDGQLHLLFAANGLPNHRWLDLDQPAGAAGETGAGWGSATRLPGWQELAGSSLTPPSQNDLPPFALAVDASTLHLLAALPDAATLRYSVWSSSTESPNGRWSQPEDFTPAGDWRNLPGAAAAIPLLGSELAVAWLAIPSTADLATPLPPASSVFIIVRSAPALQPPPALPLPPTSTPSPTPSQPPTLVPTATPSLNQAPSPSPASSLPLVLGGGLAAITVIAIFIGILLQGKRR